MISKYRDIGREFQYYNPVILCFVQLGHQQETHLCWWGAAPATRTAAASKGAALSLPPAQHTEAHRATTHQGHPCRRQAPFTQHRSAQALTKMCKCSCKQRRRGWICCVRRQKGDGIREERKRFFSRSENGSAALGNIMLDWISKSCRTPPVHKLVHFSRFC